MQIEMEYIEWRITFGIWMRRDSKNKHIIKDDDEVDRMNNLWYDKPSKLSKNEDGVDRMNIEQPLVCWGGRRQQWQEGGKWGVVHGVKWRPPGSVRFFWTRIGKRCFNQIELKYIFIEVSTLL